MTPPLAPLTTAVLSAYRLGWFPMAQSRRDQGVYWVNPEVRGILPLSRFHVPRRLMRTLRRRPYRLTVDQAFPAVIAGCARSDPVRGRFDTWINPAIRAVFLELHQEGHAHSVECWRDGELAGGLYGIAINGAFFGESMFSLLRDASKVALVHLVDRLRAGGFTLLDAQFVNDHLDQFGQERLARPVFRRLLEAALDREADFFRIASAGALPCDRYPDAIRRPPPDFGATGLGDVVPAPPQADDRSTRPRTGSRLRSPAGPAPCPPPGRLVEDMRRGRAPARSRHVDSAASGRTPARPQPRGALRGGPPRGR